MEKTFDEIFSILQQGGEVNLKSKPNGMITVSVTFQDGLRNIKRSSGFEVTMELKHSVDPKVYDMALTDHLKRCVKDINNQP